MGSSRALFIPTNVREGRRMDRTNEGMPCCEFEKDQLHARD